MDTLFFILTVVMIGGTVFYGLSMWILSRRQRRTLKRLMRLLEGDDDDRQA